MVKKFTTEQILYIQRSFCKLPGGKAVDRRLHSKTPKRTFSVPHPEKVKKEIELREKHGENVKPGFFDDLVCGKERFRYV